MPWPKPSSSTVRTWHALDGDADRLIMCERHGLMYNGDELLYVMVKDRLATGPVAGAVGTLMTNRRWKCCSSSRASALLAPRWATATC